MAEENLPDKKKESEPEDPNYLTNPFVGLSSDIPDHNTSLEEIQKIELPLVNAVVKGTLEGWSGVKTIGSLTRMIDNTFKVIRERRAMLGKPYGVESKISRGDTVVLLD